MIADFIKVLCGFVLVLSLLACGQHVPPSAELGETHRDDFNYALRWKKFKGAAEYMRPEHRKAFLATFDKLKDIHIIDVREVSVEPFDENQRFDTTLEMDYYLLPSVSVKTFRFEQSWEFFGGEDQPQNGYFIVTPFPEFP